VVEKLPHRHGEMMWQLRKQIREVTGNKSKINGVYSGKNEKRAGNTKKKPCRKRGDIWKEKKLKIQDKLGSTEIKQFS
jgi:hypothetical protein